MKYRWKDLINPIKWFAFIRFKAMQYFGYLTPEEKQWHSEVVVFRGIMCPDCKSAGECIKIKPGEDKPCGCNWAGKSGDMSMSCTLENWKAVKDKSDWDDQKGKYLHGLKFGFVRDGK